MVYLSPDELSSLLIAKKLLQDISGGTINEDIVSITQKISNILNRHVSSDGNIDESVSFQLIGYSPVPEPVFKSVLEGCLKKKRLSFTYASPAREDKNKRVVDPYHLLNYMGNWHLIAHCHLRDSVRDFALGRMMEVTVLDEDFTIPQTFNIREFFDASFGIYKSNSIRGGHTPVFSAQNEMDQGPGLAQGPEEEVSPGRVHGVDLPGGRFLGDQDGDPPARGHGGGHQTQKPAGFNKDRS